MKRKFIYGLIGIIAAASLTGCGEKNTTMETRAETVSEIKEDAKETFDANVKSNSEKVTSDEKTESITEKEVVTKEEETEDVPKAAVKADKNGVVLGDYSGFTYTRDYTAPSDVDVEETINDILDSNSSQEYLEEGTVKDGDTVVISFTGSIDGKEDENLSGEQENFTVGSGTFIDDFESKIVGQEVGKEFSFSIDFPDDYNEKTVAGKTADFTAIIESIAGKETRPELTDDWVKENTEYKTVEEYKEGIRKDLEAQEEERADSSAISSLLSDLYNASSVNLTDEELSTGIDAEKAKYEAQAADQNMEFEEYVEEYMSVGNSEEETEDYMSSFNEFLKNQVSEKIEMEKILESFCEKENVDISEEAYNAYIEKEANMYGYESTDEFIQELESVGYDKEIHNIFIEVQAGRKLMEISKEIVHEEAYPETEMK